MTDLKEQLHSYARVLDGASRTVLVAQQKDIATHRSWRLAAAVSAVALAVVAATLVAVPRWRAPLGALTANIPDRLVIDDYHEMGAPYQEKVFDPATGQTRFFELPGRVPGDMPYQLHAVGQELVYPGPASGSGLMARAYSLASGGVRDLGATFWFVPSSDALSIWLVRKLDASGQHWSMQKVSVPTGRAGPLIALPYGWSGPGAAEVSGDVVLNTLDHSALWSTDRRAFVRQFENSFNFVAARSGRLVYETDCDAAANPMPCKQLTVLDVSSNEARSVGRPTLRVSGGWVPAGSVEQSLSPDGRHLAIRALLGPPSVAHDQNAYARRTDGQPRQGSRCCPWDTMSRVAVVDLDTGKQAWIPGSDTAPYSRVAWSSDARWVYYETAAGTLGAYRIQDRVVRTFDVAVHSPVSLVVVPAAVDAYSSSQPGASIAITKEFGDCPAEAPLPPGRDARDEAVAAAKRAEPEVYLNSSYYKGSAVDHKSYEVTRAYAADSRQGMGAIASNMCGSTVARRTWIVELHFPNIEGASASQGQLFLSRFSDGWKAWYAYH